MIEGFCQLAFADVQHSETKTQEGTGRIAGDGLFESSQRNLLISSVNSDQWNEIRNGLREETGRWLQVLESPREVADVELTGMIASIAHLAYHLGAIRQIRKSARGPREGTFT